MKMENNAAILNNEALAGELATAFTALTEILNSCPASLLNKQPAAGGWTAGQLVRHISKSSAGIPDQHTRAAERPADEKEEMLKEIFLNLETKMQSPDFVRPEEKVYELTQLQAELEKNRQLLTGIARNKELTELCLDFEFPVVGYMTRYEWLRFILFHTKRHTIQLKNTLIALQ